MKTFPYLFLASFLITNCLVQKTYAQGFAPTHVEFDVPAGAGVFYPAYTGGFSFNEFNSAGTHQEGSQNWMVMDMDGDGMEDLVVTGQRMVSNSLAQSFNAEANAYWTVRLNEGTGFSSTEITWSVPTGGRIQSGTNCSFAVSEEVNAANYDVGSQNWVLRDMNADGKPDLVVTSEKTASGATKVFSPGNNPYWKVYINTGSSFSSTATNWAIPTGGFIAGGTEYGFHLINYSLAANIDVGSVNWDLIDINGDYLLDLVVTSEKMVSSTTVFDLSGSPYWKVYYNNGGGFNTNASNWALPAGGTIESGVQCGYRLSTGSSAGFYQNGSLNWSTVDLTGDLKPELVITSERFGSGNVSVFSPGTNPYWKVYTNTGNGFETTAYNFTVPTGGTVIGGTSFGLRHTENDNASSNDIGSLNWSLIKLNDDDKPDLVVSSEKFGAGSTTVFDPTGSPYWKVYFNTGTGFAAQMDWSVPATGLIFTQDRGVVLPNSIDADIYDVGSRNWFVTDLDGNKQADIIFTSEHMTGGEIKVFDQGVDPYWRAHLNSFVGLEETTSEKNTLLYPNPSSDVFQLSTTADYEKVLIYDQLGRQVTSFDKSGQYSVKELNTGLYTLVLVNADAEQVGQTMRLQILK